jgi:Double-stranded RNA binding motif
LEVNPKGQLQEILQAISPRSPVYEIVSQAGPEHQKLFVAKVLWDGLELGSGTGSSKKQAETAAALSALKGKIWESSDATRTPAGDVAGNDAPGPLSEKTPDEASSPEEEDDEEET